MPRRSEEDSDEGRGETVPDPGAGTGSWPAGARDGATGSPWFSGGGRQQCLEHLEHLACFGPPILQVAGVRGSGRTRLLAELVLKLRARRPTAVLHSSSLQAMAADPAESLDPESSQRAAAAVSELLIAAFQVPPMLSNHGERAAPETLRAWLDERDGAVLLLDDADVVDRPRLLTLLRGVAVLPELRLVLFTDVTGPVAGLLDGPEFAAPDTGFTMTLPPFDRAASEAFLAHRFGTRLALLKPRIGALHARSHGLPGRLEVLAEDELARLQALPTWLGLPRMHVVAIAAVLAVLVGLISMDRVFTGDDPDVPDPVPERFSVSSTDDFELSLPAPGSAPPSGVPADRVVSSSASTGSTAGAGDRGAATAMTDVRTDPEPPAAPAVSAPVSSRTVPNRSPGSAVAVSEVGDVAPDAPEPVRVEPEAVEPETIAASRAGSPAPTAPASGSTPDVTAPVEGFTLQLAVLSTREAAVGFAASIGPDVRVRVRERNGRRDYVVHWGRFESRAAAAAARPPAADVEPWIRPRSGLFAESTPLPQPR